MVEMTEPYIPGFLAFREVGFLMDCLEEIKREKTEILPQVRVSKSATIINISCIIIIGNISRWQWHSSSKR